MNEQKTQPELSHILVEFAEPLLQSAGTYQEREEMLSLAILAWNLALEECDERENKIAEFLAAIKKSEKTKMRQLLQLLIRRKEQHFAAVKMHIIGFQFERRGEKMQIKIESREK
jgi:hypothetical protein